MPSKGVIIAVAFGVVLFPTISAPIPSLLSNAEPLDKWMAIGLIFCDLALVQLLLLENYKSLVLFFAPNLAGIISGVGAAIYRVSLLENGNWAHRYAITVLLIMIFIYSVMVFLITISVMGPQNDWYDSPFMKKLALAGLVLYYVVCPAAALIYTIVHFPASWVWICINYGMIILFVILFAKFLKQEWSSGFEDSAASLVCSLFFYCVIYTPFATYSITQGFKEFQAKASHTTNSHYFAFIPITLGSICCTGVLIDIVAPITLLGYGCWLVIKKVFKINTGNGSFIPGNDIPNNQQGIALDVGAGLRRSLIDTQFEETNEETCSICWEDFKENDKLKKVKGCNHTFHISCLEYWYKKSSTCPMCRVNIKM